MDWKNIVEKQIHRAHEKINLLGPQWRHLVPKGEPDYELSEYRDHKIIIMRNDMANLNGYVELKKDHPYAGLSYDQMDIDVHWGLTYGDMPDDGAYKKYDLDVLFIGFDTAHGTDFVPLLYSTRKMHTEISKKYADILGLDSSIIPCNDIFTKSNYKGINFVRSECHKIVDQLIEKYGNK